MTLEQIREIAEAKFDFSVCLKSAYKLCDYKPSYGFLFEEYINNYSYWGHCDCDLIFGKLGSFLDPLFEEGYDKIFASGHLTFYKNNFENNRRFMKPYNGRLIYKEAFETDNIYVFDEDIREDNVHRLFLEDKAKVFQTDLSMNVSPSFARIRRSYYNSKMHNFCWEPFKEARYYWNDGRIIEYYLDCGRLQKKEYLYIHLQSRKMRFSDKILHSKDIEILPDRFSDKYATPDNEKELRLWSIKFTYLRKFDVLAKKIKRKLNICSR